MYNMYICVFVCAYALSNFWFKCAQKATLPNPQPPPQADAVYANTAQPKEREREHRKQTASTVCYNKCVNSVKCVGFFLLVLCGNCCMRARVTRRRSEREQCACAYGDFSDVCILAVDVLYTAGRPSDHGQSRRSRKYSKQLALLLLRQQLRFRRRCSYRKSHTTTHTRTLSHTSTELLY